MGQIQTWTNLQSRANDGETTPSYEGPLRPEWGVSALPVAEVFVGAADGMAKMAERRVTEEKKAKAATTMATTRTNSSVSGVANQMTGVWLLEWASSHPWQSPN